MKSRILLSSKGGYKVQTKFLGIWWDDRYLAHCDGPSSLYWFKTEDEARNHIEKKQNREEKTVWTVIHPK